LHPGPDHGYRLANEIAAEFWVLEGGNLHHGATAWFDGRRSGADSVQFTGVTPANRSDGGNGLHEVFELRRCGRLRLLDDDRPGFFVQI